MPQVGEYEYNTETASILGRGSQGAVYRGYHQTTGDQVAIKVIHKKTKYTDQELQILQKVSKLNSPHLVALLHHEKSTDHKLWCLHFVTEFCNSGDLKGYLTEHRPDNALAQDLMHQFALGLQVLYTNEIVHRDLKPENLLLHTNPSTQELVLKIADLGVAKVLEANEDADSFVGTYMYMAPEVVLQRRYDFKVDLWSFGVIASQCYKGSHTHPIQNVTEKFNSPIELYAFYTNTVIHILTDGLPATLANLLKMVLVPDPRRRIEPREFFSHSYFQQQFEEETSGESTPCNMSSGYSSVVDSNVSRPTTTSRVTRMIETFDNVFSVSAQRPSSFRKNKQDGGARYSQLQSSSTQHKTLTSTPSQVSSDSHKQPLLPSAKRLLQEHNHYIDQDDVLRDASTQQKFIYEMFGDDAIRNEDRYEAIAETIQEFIGDKLETGGLHKVFLPLQKDSPKIAEEHKSFVFVTTRVKLGRKTNKLLILIQGSGRVRAGEWSRRLSLNDSLIKGSMLPMVKIAGDKGYDILILNPNLNKAIINDVEVSIPQNGTVLEHSTYVWKELISPCNPQFIAMVAHSAGGQVVNHWMNTFAKEFEQRVKAVAMTDACLITQANRKLLGERYREWVTSVEDRGTILSADSRQSTLDGAADQSLTVISAGTLVHEETTFMATDEIFQFFEERYQKLSITS